MIKIYQSHSCKNTSTLICERKKERKKEREREREREREKERKKEERERKKERKKDFEPGFILSSDFSSGNLCSLVHYIMLLLHI